MISNRPYAPPPEGFRDRFIRGGWRAVEAAYGARTALNKRWINELGGLSVLRSERKAYLAALKEQRTQ